MRTCNPGATYSAEQMRYVIKAYKSAKEKENVKKKRKINMQQNLRTYREAKSTLLKVHISDRKHHVHKQYNYSWLIKMT